MYLVVLINHFPFALKCYFIKKKRKVFLAHLYMYSSAIVIVLITIIIIIIIIFQQANNAKFCA